MINCENCGEPHDKIYGSGRFCSPWCARSFATKKERKEINKKVSKTLKGTGHNSVIKKCDWCKKEFKIKWIKRNQKCCSRSCSSLLRCSDLDYIENMSTSMIKAHIDG